ncbi:hypothetical protein BC830DRAFT_1133185 [Chytriomyces sp. MP71]|nr:hypothetical protein BC830DRAFT_1133185 [Chytriomyces sp. MP71]
MACMRVQEGRRWGSCGPGSGLPPGGRRTANWAQIGRGIDAVRTDLGEGFFDGIRLHGLRDLSVYARSVTFSDPFHYIRFTSPDSPSPSAPSSPSPALPSADGSAEPPHSSPHGDEARSDQERKGDASKQHHHHHHQGPKLPLLDSLPPIITSALPTPPPLPQLNLPHGLIPPFGRGGYLVKGRVPYATFVALVRLVIKLYYHDASLEVVRCKSVIGGPLKPADLDDQYSPSSSSSSTDEAPDAEGGSSGGDGSGSGSGVRGEDVWRRKRGNESHDDSVRLVIRWMFEGTPRHTLYFASIFNPLNLPQPRVYEGVFVYTFDNDSGLIVNHRLESMSPTPWIPAICKWWIARKARAKAAEAAAGGAGGGREGVPQLNTEGKQ